MTNNDKLERQRFLDWWISSRNFFHHSNHGPTQNTAWDAWQARAKQERNHD